MVGPTGSGKTSTMNAMLDHLKSDEVNLISLEDPVEYHIDKVCQVQINEKTGLTFANALRAVLRQDPDIIAVGEIRDGETAEIAMRSAMTGHLVLSTIHTNDAVSSIDRLIDIGVEPYLVAGALRGIVSQRLLRRICPHCKKPYTPTAEEVEMMGLPEGTYQFYRGEGCSECFHTGYRGRVGVFEILTMTPEIRLAIHSRSVQEMEAAVAKSNFIPILQNCAELVQEGVTTVQEVARTVGKGQS
jgi:type IV pilus assembly protein PilB